LTGHTQLIRQPRSSSFEAFEEVVGREHVLTDPDIVASYVVDWTGRYRGHSPAVVRPGSTEEVAGVLSICAASGIAVTPQGGKTGLVGGSVPLEGEVVLSLTRLTSVGEVDDMAGQITVGSASRPSLAPARSSPISAASGRTTPATT
jgi:FAD/FMN-containing dehydrogenase